jgi:Sec-independent protein translocase protein TatA
LVKLRAWAVKTLEKPDGTQEKTRGAFVLEADSPKEMGETVKSVRKALKTRRSPSNKKIQIKELARQESNPGTQNQTSQPLYQHSDSDSDSDTMKNITVNQIVRIVGSGDGGQRSLPEPAEE